MVDLAKLLNDIEDDIDLNEGLGLPAEFSLRCKVAIRELAAERDALRAELEEKNTELKKWKYVPGVMHCAKCNFQSIKSVLNISSGAVTAGDSNPEPCPNGCGPLWRVSWEKYANDHYEDGVKTFEKLRAAEAELEALRKQEPCGWQSRFITPTETWGFCSKEHYETVKAAPHEYPGYEVRAVYASPVPAQQPEAADALIERLWQNSNHGTRREDIEAAFKAGAANAQQPADGTDINVGTLTKDKIREIFIRNGFTIKEGCDDLKDYVYSAARELIAAVPEQQNTDTAQFSRDPYDLADELYLRGYSDCRLERDYDPRGGEEWQAVVDAIGSEVKR